MGIPSDSKRSDNALAGQIEGTQIRLRQFIIDLDNLDATLRLFAPGIDLEDIRPKPLPPRNAAFKGEVARLALSMLRQSDKPLTSQDIALQLHMGTMRPKKQVNIL